MKRSIRKLSSNSAPFSRPLRYVVAGLILRGEHPQREVLICQRSPEKPMGLKWEFPGGKVESGETPKEALVRELREELAIESTIGEEIARYRHDYPNGSSVVLLFYAVTGFKGEPTGRVFEQIQWVERTMLTGMDFLDGDLDFVQRLARGEFDARFVD